MTDNIMFSPDNPPPGDQLPYGGAVRDFLIDVAATAMRAEDIFNGFAEKIAKHDEDLTDDQRELMLTAATAMANAYGVVALARWIENEYGPASAHKAASMVQCMFHNGGMGSLDGDAGTNEVLSEAERKIRYQDEMHSRRTAEQAGGGR